MLFRHCGRGGENFMNLTRKEFLFLSSKVAAGAALGPSLSSLGMAGLVDDIHNVPAVRKIHEHIAREKEKHIASVQADLRQPSVSSWNMGINEMAHRMIDSFRAIGCKEAELVPTEGLPGIWAYHDAGAPKTLLIYIMYDTQPFELEASGAKWGKGPQKQPIHSGAKAILDSPAWRLVDALRNMYDPQTNRILIDGFYDAIRPPNDEEEAMLEQLIRQSGSQLLEEQKKNARSWINDWSDAEAMRHFLFDTTMNINGMWSGYTGPGAATIVPEKATAKIDFRLVPNQDVATQQKLVEEHLRKHGFGDFEYRSMGGGDEWSQTSVREPLVQSLLTVYRANHVEPAAWPRSPASTPEAAYTRKVGLPAVRGGMGHGGNEHVNDEYIVIEGTGEVAGYGQAQPSTVDLLS